MDAGFERPTRAHQRLDGEGTGGVGGIGEPSPIDGEASLGEHAFRPVEQAQSLLRLELNRLEPLGLEHAGGGDPLAVDQEEALADERAAQVSERGEVTRGPHRSPVGNTAGAGRGGGTRRGARQWPGGRPSSPGPVFGREAAAWHEPSAGLSRSPTPEAWLRTRSYWSSVACSAGMRVYERAPKPVVMP
jgi:hypothetical protein